MEQSRLAIIRNERITQEICRMVLHTGRPVVEKPGQFLNIKLEGRFLRRPISVCDWDEETVTILYKIVGAGTEQMAGMQAGETLDVLLPLGNGFDTAESGARPLLVGGGVGIPPLYGLAKTLVASGITPVVAMGFNESSQVILEEDFRVLGAEVLIATLDGSCGETGFVTDLVRDLDVTSVYACGPEPMLRALDACIREEIPGSFSFEERMGCGFGACMGCSCKTKYGAKRICKDGPILERREILW